MMVKASMIFNRSLASFADRNAGHRELTVYGIILCQENDMRCDRSLHIEEF